MLIQYTLYYYTTTTTKLYIHFFKVFSKIFDIILQKTAGFNQVKLFKPKKKPQTNVSNVLSHN